MVTPLRLPDMSDAPLRPSAATPEVLPNWRARRVLSIMDAGGSLKLLRRGDEGYVRTMVRILKREERWFRQAQRANYGALAMSDEYRAELYGEGARTNNRIRAAQRPMCGAWCMGLEGDPYLKAVMEAHILAGREAKYIAARIAVDPKFVEWYEALFFDVRGMAKRRDWIVRNALGGYLGKVLPGEREGFMTPSWGRFLKYLGYFGGKVVLNAALTPMLLEFPQRDAKSPKKWEGGIPRVTSFAQVMMLYYVWVSDPYDDKNITFIEAARRQAEKMKIVESTDDRLEKGLAAMMEYSAHLEREAALDLERKRTWSGEPKSGEADAPQPPSESEAEKIKRERRRLHILANRGRKARELRAREDWDREP